jgi:hypothetical protein
MKLRSKLQLIYVALRFVTFLFQVWWRAFFCSGGEECARSFIKAAIWSIVWPVYWVFFLRGFQ